MANAAPRIQREEQFPEMSDKFSVLSHLQTGGMLHWVKVCCALHPEVKCGPTGFIIDLSSHFCLF